MLSHNCSVFVLWMLDYVSIVVPTISNLTISSGLNLCQANAYFFFFLVDFVERTFTSSSFGANGVMCLLNSSNISIAVKCLALIFTLLKPAVSVYAKKRTQ